VSYSFKPSVLKKCSTTHCLTLTCKRYRVFLRTLNFEHAQIDLAPSFRKALFAVLIKAANTILYLFICFDRNCTIETESKTSKRTISKNAALNAQKISI